MLTFALFLTGLAFGIGAALYVGSALGPHDVSAHPMLALVAVFSMSALGFFAGVLCERGFGGR